MLVANLAQALQLSGCKAIFGTSSTLLLNGKLNVKAMDFTFFHFLCNVIRSMNRPEACAPYRRPLGAWALICCMLWMVLAVGRAEGAADFDRLLANLTQRWGNASTAKFHAWRALIQAGVAATETERIKRVNTFFNQQLQFSDDVVVWSQPDYWATPMESLGRGAGDCEDFAIAKYFTLLQSGVASEKLRLIYVRAKTGSADGAPTQAHMVLAYYAQPDAEPLIMDNLILDIRPASRRPDLAPVFSFNSAGVFAGIAGGEAAAAGGTGRLSRWEDLLRRAKAEGFE